MKNGSGKKRPMHRKDKKESEGSEEEKEDVTILGNSLSVGVRSVRELIRAVTGGTREFQELLHNECSLIYECNVCRNLFRSVANFISHKRKYCRKHYRYFSDDSFSDQLNSKSEIPIPQADEDWETSTQRLETESERAYIAVRSGSPRLELSPVKKMRSHVVSEEPAVVCRLETVPETRNAVYQTALHQQAVTSSMRQEMTELDQRSRLQEAVLMPDGTTTTQGQAGQHKCNSCSAYFPAQVALRRHEAVYHRPRTCYPCPLCKTFFASAWCVYRHLTKKHNKSEEQIRRLREAVLSKALKRELYQPPRSSADSSSLSLPSVTTRTEEEKWNAQFHGALHCSVCGKSFSRRAALNVHSVKCKPAPDPASTSNKAGPQRCEKCGKEFARRAVLTAHIQNCNGHAEPRRLLTCRLCARVFARRRLLTLHLQRCPRTPRSPLARRTTPSKFVLPTGHNPPSPSAIQVRRDYNKLSPLVSPLNSLLPTRPLPAKLEAVVRKLHDRPSVPPPRPTVMSTNMLSFQNIDLSESSSQVRPPLPLNGSRLVIPQPVFAMALLTNRSNRSPKDSKVVTFLRNSRKAYPIKTKVAPLSEIPMIDLEPTSPVVTLQQEIKNKDTGDATLSPVSDKEDLALRKNNISLSLDKTTSPILLVNEENEKAKTDASSVLLHSSKALLENIAHDSSERNSEETLPSYQSQLMEVDVPSDIEGGSVRPLGHGSSAPQFTLPTALSSSRVCSPTGDAVDTLSDIEIHCDLVPSSPIHYTEQIRQETDSDVVSLTSRETVRSEDSCSREDTPPAPSLSCPVADDSGVSDDGCLPELDGLKKWTPFIGFDKPASQDNHTRATLNALVNDLNTQIEILRQKRVETISST